MSRLIVEKEASLRQNGQQSQQIYTDHMSNIPAMIAPQPPSEINPSSILTGNYHPNNNYMNISQPQEQNMLQQNHEEFSQHDQPNMIFPPIPPTYIAESTNNILGREMSMQEADELFENAEKLVGWAYWNVTEQ